MARKRKMSPLGRLLEEATRLSFGGAPGAEALREAYWTELARRALGDPLGRQIDSARRLSGGELRLRVGDAQWRDALRRQRDEIARRIHELEPSIERISFES